MAAPAASGFRRRVTAPIEAASPSSRNDGGRRAAASATLRRTPRSIQPRSETGRKNGAENAHSHAQTHVFLAARPL